MATTSFQPGTLNVTSGTDAELNINESGIKQHIDERVEELKKAVAREGDDEKMQDLVDLTRVLIEEIRGMREDMNRQDLSHIPPPQPQPQHTHQLAQQALTGYDGSYTTSSGTGTF
jgi:hypothetical protein